MDSEYFTYLRTIFALAFVVGLIFLCAVLVKKTGLDKRLAGNKSAVRRLSIIETMYVDPKHRLVLVKCDNREHLLLLGISSDLLVESHTHEENA